MAPRVVLHKNILVYTAGGSSRARKESPGKKVAGLNGGELVSGQSCQEC